MNAPRLPRALARAIQRLQRSRGSVLTVASLLVLGAAPARAVDLLGQPVDLVYDFGNSSGTLSATVGAGAEFALIGAPSQGPAFSTATIDITAHTVTITHNRGTRLGPGFPTISDDFLDFTFPNLPTISIETVTQTANPMPEWFGGLSFTGNSISLTQVQADAGVGTQLNEWTVGQLNAQVWGGADWGELVWGGVLPAIPAMHGAGLIALGVALVSAGAHLTRRRDVPATDIDVSSERARRPVRTDSTQRLGEPLDPRRPE